MAVCNIFKKFDSGNNGQGIFFTFSQYADDLTKESTLQSEYRVVPSKFVCLELNVDSAINTYYGGNVPAGGENICIPQLLQSFYENKISYLKGEQTYYPEDATKYLFTFLRDRGFIQSDSSITDTTYFPEVKYIGDINIYSNENVQDINYNEIYCMVPAEAKRYFYKNEINEESDPYPVSGTPTMINGWRDGNDPQDDSPYNPYPEDLTGLEGTPEFYPPASYTYSMDYELPRIIYNGTNDTIVQDDESFNFNCIIVLYDVYKGDNIAPEVYCAPLGIWFSGDVFEDTTDNNYFKLKNSVTKFVRSDSIFDQGTSYGLRVCTKYISSPLGTSLVAKTDSPNTDQFHTEFAEVCDQFSQAIVEMNNFNRILADEHTNIVDYITQFTNQRVNVPYIKIVNNIPHWFVNGRDTGVAQYIAPEE